eukprot:865843-Karenia_brevis.AAC.1
MAMEGMNFFIRPLISNVVLLDLDGFQGDMEAVLKLQPRAVVRTSNGNFQAWLTVPSSLAGKTALMITSELTCVLGGDKASAKPGQQGRMPGSVNVKPGKMEPTVLIHSADEHMNEQVFLSMTKGKK